MREDFCMWVFILNLSIFVLGERQCSLINFNCYKYVRVHLFTDIPQQFGTGTEFTCVHYKASSCSPYLALASPLSAILSLRRICVKPFH